MMALIKFGGGVVDMRGSIAGTTFARNSYGAYARGRTKPINPNTALQQGIRSIMLALTTAWSNTLTAANRAAWDVYAASIDWQNRLGETVKLTGFNHFIRSNLTLLNGDLAQVNAGPVTLSLPTSDQTLAVAVSEATQLCTVTFADTADWCDTAGSGLLLYAGQPVNVTRNFFKGPYKLAGCIAGSVGTPPSTGDTIANPYQVAEDMKQFFYARIAHADGRVSNPFQVSCDVAA